MEQNERISKMDALLFTLSLEVALEQMRVLEGSAELRIQQWQPGSKLERLQRDKLVRDREMVNDIIRRTLVEVAETGQWQTLQKAVCLLTQLHKESAATTLRLNNEQLRLSRDAISDELGEKRNKWEIELRNADQSIAVLRDKMSDDLINSSARLGYADKWLFARAESLQLRCEASAPPPCAPAPRHHHEQRVHDELLAAYELQIKERENSLEYWRKRYTVDIATISTRVADKCDQLRVANSRRNDLQKLYDLHAGEMRGWLTFKRERAARLAREENQRISATRIQAWWRGVMVRRALGCFKYLRHFKKAPTKSKKK